MPKDMLTSISNDKVKLVRALQSRPRNRREAEAFVVEGVRLTDEAQQSGRRPSFVFYTDFS